MEEVNSARVKLRVPASVLVVSGKHTVNAAVIPGMNAIASP
jgi:hypothetical protein